MKRIALTVASGLLIVAGVLAGLGLYVVNRTHVLERNAALGVKVAEFRSNGGGQFVRVSGFSGESACTVKNVTVKRYGPSVAVFVHVHLAHKGEAGDFQYDVPVPSDVNSIRFGNEGSVIWNREASGS